MGSVLDTAALPIAAKKYEDTFTSQLKPFFPDDPLLELGSDRISWDLEEYNDIIDDVYTTAGGDPIAMSKEAIALGVAVMPGLSYRVTLTERDLMWEKVVGDLGQSMSDARARKLAQEIGAKIRRIERQKEHERAMALSGTLAYNIGSAAQSVDMGLAATQTPTASASWATAGTNIIGDLLEWSSLLEAICGEPAKYVLMNSNTFKYLASNTALKDWAKASVAGTATQVDPNGGLVIPICGLTAVLVNKSYTKAGTRTKYIPDDKAVLLPDPARLTPGSEILGPALDTNGNLNWGLTTKIANWPDGKTTIDVKKASLNILTRPKAVVYADVTP